MREDFKNAIDAAFRVDCGQRAIYLVFDRFDWDVTEDEVAYAAEKAGFKPGWVYYHTGPRLRESRAKRDHDQKIFEEARRRQEDTMNARQQADMNARYRQYQNAAYDHARANQRAQQRAQPEQQTQFNFEWLFRAGMREAQVAANGCPGHIEPKLRRFGLTWPFTAAELKKAYRKRCMETHPDRGGSSEAFNEVQKDNTDLEHYAKESK
jgi:hypothetical protein